LHHLLQVFDLNQFENDGVVDDEVKLFLVVGTLHDETFENVLLDARSIRVANVFVFLTQ
jgi:hypothetical protein